MRWQIDPSHSLVEFSVKHMAISTVKGRFTSFTASGATNEDGVPTALAMEIDAASIDTNNAQRDGHLRSPDFFDVANHPALTFRSTKVSGTRDALTVEGELTMRGVTKPITLRGAIVTPVKDPWGNPRTSLEVSGAPSRSAFGLTWNQALEFGGVLVSDEVKLTIEAQATAKEPAALSA
jgi:polyisoprenoid-binding protein YceI